MICERFLPVCFRESRFVRELVGIWKYGDTRVATIASILSAYAWAACLLWEGETMARPTYKHMAEVLPTDDHWAALFIAVGTLQFWRLYTRTSRKSIKWEYLLKIVACSMWSFVGLSCMFSVYPPPAAMSDTLVIALGCWWDMVRFDYCRICQEEVCESGDCPYAR